MCVVVDKAGGVPALVGLYSSGGDNEQVSKITRDSDRYRGRSETGDMRRGRVWCVCVVGGGGAGVLLRLEGCYFDVL